MKKVKVVKVAAKVDMGGILIDQALPIDDIGTVDPFLLIHHWKSYLPGGQLQKDVGVGPHPHRGFSPVTLIVKGSLHHRDSLGNDSIVDEGGIQWMNAGKGVTHSERPSKELANSGGEFEIIQFWVNSKSDSKMLPANYYAIHEAELPVVELAGNASLQIISGQYRDVRSAYENNNHLNVFRLHIGKDAAVKLDIPLNHNVILYQIEGISKVNTADVPMDKSMILFESTGEEIHIKAVQNSDYLILSGEPLNEKVSQYGPFVMNNMTQIMEAIRDAQNGKMGILIEEFQ